MSMRITNQTGVPLEAQTVMVFWNNDTGHQIGSDKTLRLLEASLDGVPFWSGDVFAPTFTISPSGLFIPTGDSTVRFTFHQIYDQPDTAERIIINLGTNGCQAYPIDSAAVTPTPTTTLTQTATLTPTPTVPTPHPPTITFTPTFTPSATASAMPTQTFTLSPSPTTAGGFPTTVVRDNFNRANGSIGTSWSGYPSAFSIASNQLDVVATGSNTFILWNGSSFGSDQEAYVTLAQVDTASTNQHRLILKSQSSKGVTSGLLYVMYDGVSQTVQVWTHHPIQGWVQHGASIAATFVNGDQFGARARPDGTVEVYRNGTLLGTRSITSWPFYNSGGYIGLWFVNAPNALLDNFGGGTR
jgi:hypothetical protein